MIIIRILAVLAIVLIVLPAAETHPAAASETLRITFQLPLTHPLGRNLEMFKEEVERASNGEIRIEIYPASQLYRDYEVPQAVASGAIEMGVSPLTRFAGTIPAVDIFDVPFMFQDTEAIVRATTRGSPVRDPIDAAILETGARVLWWMDYGGAVMISKGRPLPTPADVQGLKVRVFGRMLGQFVEAVDGVPTMTSGSEQFLAYQRGTVDAGMTGLTGVSSRRLDQVMDWITLTNHASIQFMCLINDQVWNRLSQDHQQILLAAAERAEQALRAEIAADEAAALAYARERGMGVYELSAEERALWIAATETVVNRYLEHAGPLGAQLVGAARVITTTN